MLDCGHAPDAPRAQDARHHPGRRRRAEDALDPGRVREAHRGWHPHRGGPGRADPGGAGSDGIQRATASARGYGGIVSARPGSALTPIALPSLALRLADLVGWG